MQRLFEGKKTAYVPADLQMQSIRIRSSSRELGVCICACFFFFSLLAEELINAYEIAKNKCFFSEEQILVSIRALI